MDLQGDTDTAPVKDDKDGKLCKVCGHSAAGIFFGALVCVPCKAFFIRATTESTGSFMCQGDRACYISATNRSCKYCRFQRCLTAGMCRKERPTSVQTADGQQLCVVCGDVANGVHFGAVTCEGCKKFFRRGLHDAKFYTCKEKSACDINPRSRNACRYCRFQKCTQMGMSREAIQMGRPSKVKKMNESLQKQFNFPVQSDNSLLPDENVTHLKPEQDAPRSCSKLGTIPAQSTSSHQPNPDQLELISSSIAVKTLNTTGSSFSKAAAKVTEPPVSSASDHASHERMKNDAETEELVFVSTATKVLKNGTHDCDTGGLSVRTLPAETCTAASDIKPLCDVKQEDLLNQQHIMSTPGETHNGLLQDIALNSRNADLLVTVVSAEQHTKVLDTKYNQNESLYSLHNVNGTSDNALPLRESVAMTTDCNQIDLTQISDHTLSVKTENAEENGFVKNISSCSLSDESSGYESKETVDCPGISSTDGDCATGSESSAERSLMNVDTKQYGSPIDGDSPMSTMSILSRSSIGDCSLQSEEGAGNIESITTIAETLSSSLIEDKFPGIIERPTAQTTMENSDSDRITSEFTSTSQVGCVPFPMTTAADNQESSQMNSDKTDASVNSSFTGQEIRLDIINKLQGNTHWPNELVPVQTTSTLIEPQYDSNYWLHPVLPDENVFFREEHMRFINDLLAKYEDFERTGVQVNNYLAKAWQDLAQRHGERYKLEPSSVLQKSVSLYVSLGVSYCNELPEFHTLSKEDQSSILRMGENQARVVMASASWYKKGNGRFDKAFYPNVPPTWRVDYTIYSDWLKVAEDVQTLELDSIEAALVTALVIFATDYPGLKHPEVIEVIRTKILRSFRAFTTAKYGSGSNRIEKVFTIIPNIRRLGVLYTDCMRNIDFKAGQI